MTRICLTMAIGVLLLASCTSGPGQVTSARQPGVHETPVGEYVVCGPYSHDNLTVFLVRGPDRLKGKQYLTLHEAMAQKKAVVHETGHVNELAIENVSDEDVYVQAGDIVRGGQQDRTLGTDMVLAAHSGKVPIASFCVEHGRWTGRPGESSARFASAEKCVTSNDLKLAVKYASNQQQVWDRVARQQAELSQSVGQPVAAAASPSSLELTLDHDKIKDAKAAYHDALGKLLDGKSDIVGYAFAINGDLTCADLYAGPGLMRRLWPKLLDSSIVEAISRRGGDGAPPKAAPTTSDVRGFFAAADAAAAQSKDVSKRTQVISRDAPGCVLFETRDRDGGEAIHRNYLRKSADAGRAPTAAPNGARQERVQQQQLHQQLDR